MGCIYMRISPSGGKYVGQTILNENRRWQQHCKAANNPNATDYNTIICRAIRKYGADNFSVIILENNIPEELLDEREIFWINYYKTYFYDNQHGYNMTRGGKGARKFKDEELLNLWNEGLSLKEIGDILQGTPFYLGKRLEQCGINKELFRQRGSLTGAKTLRENNPTNKQIYTLWTQGMSLTDIRKILKIDIHTAANMLKNTYNISDTEINLRKNEAIAKQKSQPIKQYDLKNNFIKDWPSATIAAKELNIDNSSIRKCIKGQRKTAGGFQWKTN